MLGCQDFCGYYDWTFLHVRRRFGEKALRDLWADAIGADSQRHYERNGRENGLAGLLRTWTKTGEEEHCDWTFALDDKRGVLRWDMRQCPSKGFLLANDLNADEDYCDHCMGWIIPLLDRIGMEMKEHAHNHCGQCWGEIGMKGRGHDAMSAAGDVRCDARWKRGYLDCWKDGRKLPFLPAVTASPDSCDVLTAWFARTDRLLVLGRGPSARPIPAEAAASAVLVADTTYATRDVFDGEPKAVLFSDIPRFVPQVAERFNATPPAQRPLLMHTYLPAREPVDFVSLGLPRPAPVLPWLIRRDYYRHEPGLPYPTTGVFLALLAISLGKPTTVLGVDLYEHPSGKVYATDEAASGPFVLPPRHSRECDLDHLRRALGRATAEVLLTARLREMIEQGRCPG